MSRKVVGRIFGAASTLTPVLLFLSACAASAESQLRVTDRDILPDWHGVWRGALEDLPDPLAVSPDVRFTVNPGADEEDNCLIWRFEYSINGIVEGLKDYELCRESEHVFRLEEGAGVYLNVSVFGDDLYSAFALAEHGIALFTHTRREGDVIVQDIYSTKGEDTPAPGLSTFIGVKRQRVILQRVETP